MVTYSCRVRCQGTMFNFLLPLAFVSDNECAQLTSIHWVSKGSACAIGDVPCSAPMIRITEAFAQRRQDLTIDVIFVLCNKLIFNVRLTTSQQGSDEYES